MTQKLRNDGMYFQEHLALGYYHPLVTWVYLVTPQIIDKTRMKTLFQPQDDENTVKPDIMSQTYKKI